MKHVLFVDDETNVLAGLRRMLHGQRAEWSLGFVSSGEEALAYLGRHPVDVLVSDMRMPGMSGAELFQEVVARHPEVVRIALSGQSNEETLMKVAGLAHQYLSKPCDADTLKATVRRACALRSRLSDETLKRLVARMSAIPSLPSHYQEVAKELSSPEPSLPKIGDIIARDVAMTAKVLQLVNSAFFGVPRRVTNAKQAVTLLGLHTVNGLMLSAGVFSQFDDRQFTHFSLDELLSHSLQVAALAKQIAAQQPHEEANDAFVAGLLHDVGKLVLATNFPRQYGLSMQAAQETGSSLTEVEREIFGADHATVGAHVLDLWGLPSALIEAVAFHHEPSKSMNTAFTALTAVHVAHALAQGGPRFQPGRETPGELDEEYLQSIGALKQLEMWRAIPIAGKPAGATLERENSVC